jgi:dGTPase
LSAEANPPKAGILPAGCAVPQTGPLSERAHPESAHPYRSSFQRDRARVIHSRAFRRLAGKTQVFTYRHSDHFRSRLTHTMEVAQIARAIASALGLNDDLTEALALAHDVGHPPFGHAGERALDDALREFGLRFDHNLHALRIVESFEIRYAAFRGLNLTLGVREGIVKHSRDYSPVEHPELQAYFLELRPPLEAQLIDLADEIAYLTADLEDGYEAEMLELNDIRAHVALFDQAYRSAQHEYPGAAEKLLFNEALKRMLNTLVGDLIQATAECIDREKISTLEAVRQFPERVVRFTPQTEELRRATKQYLYAALYNSKDLERALRESSMIVRDLFTCWVRDPSLLPPTYQSQVNQEGAPRVVADYIAGMTDNYIQQQHQAWRKGRRSSLPEA